MGKFFDQITDEQANLIRNSKLFFVASSSGAQKTPVEGPGPVNLSPKGATPLIVIDANTVAYLDYPGSGNETAHHIKNDLPITLMVMAMDEQNAAIVRLYGRGRVYSISEETCPKILLENTAEHLGRPRQVIELGVERTQTSCGYGVPIFEYRGERAPEGRGRTYK